MSGSHPISNKTCCYLVNGFKLSVIWLLRILSRLPRIFQSDCHDVGPGWTCQADFLFTPSADARFSTINADKMKLGPLTRYDLTRFPVVSSESKQNEQPKIRSKQRYCQFVQAPMETGRSTILPTILQFWMVTAFDCQSTFIRTFGRCPRLFFTA